MREYISEKDLEGLEFHASEPRKVEKDGIEKTRYFPTHRPLTPDDILDAQIVGGVTIIVTKDGRKYRLGDESPEPMIESREERVQESESEAKAVEPKPELQEATEDLTMKEIKDILEYQGVEVPKKARKADLIRLVHQLLPHGIRPLK